MTCQRKKAYFVFVFYVKVHFQRSPSQFRKIINAFDSWNKKTVKDPLQVYRAVSFALKSVFLILLKIKGHNFSFVLLLTEICRMEPWLSTKKP